MDRGALTRVAGLIHRRNQLDAEIGSITGRPVVAGHLGEWIAAQIFDITLEASAVSKAIDGTFATGPLAGRTVNVKWYGKREGLLDVVEDPLVEYYLVMTGPRGGAVSSRGGTRPLVIEGVYLFNAAELLGGLRGRGVKIGVATSVITSAWDRAEVFPASRNSELSLSAQQREALALFAASAGAEG
jgi:hypothetical protein